MRTVAQTQYRFDELSDKAQERAVTDAAISMDYAWADDALASLKAFAEAQGSDLRDYSIDWASSGRSYLTFADVSLDPWEFMPEDGPDGEGYSMDDKPTPEAEAEALAEWMADLLADRKAGYSCGYTGYCADADCVEGACIAFDDGETDPNEILRAAGEHWLASVCADYEYQTSAEAFADHAEANDYWFDEDGEIV